MRIFGLFLAVAFCLFTFGAHDNAWAKEPTLVKLETSMGDIVIKLDEKNAPNTSANFKQYVEDGFYDGTIFHRVIKGFMIQGGGMDSEMKEKATRASIQNEADNGLKNTKYTLAMARTNDPHSASAQFFINVNDNEHLNHRSKTSSGWGYAVFGQVVEGKDVVDKIAAVPTTSSGFHGDVPATPIVIKKATIVQQ